MLALPSQHASNAAYHPYARISPPDMPPTLLTILTCLRRPPHTGLILTLLQPPQDETKMPPPSPPSPPLMRLNPCLFFSAAYNSYATTGPSRYASDTTLNPP
ncbi:hypothetical protein O181_120474 [Austropuccinia psidii MF-1]|uniref:Uncharacterized protein n=1 Tax=Austropuccinia psidii MF-1 TaxID=1389203 RepID=A0A9Q3Q0F2_9BASI|nr:hypothetical protein [Austropuccinia psidii MF-1]